MSPFRIMEYLTQEDLNEKSCTSKTPFYDSLCDLEPKSNTYNSTIFYNISS